MRKAIAGLCGVLLLYGSMVNAVEISGQLQADSAADLHSLVGSEPKRRH